MIDDQFCADVICTALEGGIGYWARAGVVTTVDDVYTGAVLYDAEDEEDWQHVLDYDAVRRGTDLMFDPETAVSSQLRDWLRIAVRDNDTINVDADVADVIVQLACFGEIVYG